MKKILIAITLLGLSSTAFADNNSQAVSACNDFKSAVNSGKIDTGNLNGFETNMTKYLWCDVDSYQKYGNIDRLIFWKGEFIGWISYSGRWIDHKIFNTVNPDAWKELMHVMYEISGYKKCPGISGVTVVDMSTKKVEDCTSVPGFTEPDYGSDCDE